MSLNTPQLSHLAALMQEIRPHLAPIGAALGCLLGAGVFFSLSFDPAWVWGLLPLGAGLIALGLAWRKTAVAGALLLVFAGLSYLLACWQVERVVPIDYAAAQKPHWLVGRVTEVIYKEEKPGRATLRMEEVDAYGLGRERLARAGVGVYANQVTDLKAGDAVAVPVVLMTPDGPKYNGQRDGRLWRYFDDNRVSGYVLGTVEPTTREDLKRGMLEDYLSRTEQLRQRIYEGTQGVADGTVAALLVGEEKGITKEIRDAYRATGLSHLLAISGMQLTIVALGIFGALRWLGALVPWVALRVNVRLWAAVVALGGTVFYTILAGASVSLVRASIMAGIVMLAVITGRLRNGLRAWCVAVVLVICFNPLMVTRAGFQLSAAAVLGLVLLAMVERERWQGKLLHWVRGLVLATVVAGAATAPVVVGNFGQFSVLGMLANLVAVPVMALATYLGMAALLLWPMGWHQPAVDAMAMVVGWVNDWALWLSGFGFASLQVDRGLWWVVAVFAIITIGAVLVRRWVEAVVGVVCMTGVVLVIAKITPQPDVLVWDGGRTGLVREGEGYRVIWAEDMDDLRRVADMAGVKVLWGESVSSEPEGSLMLEQFAWAERIQGQWRVGPVTCDRIWQRTAEEC